MKNWADYAECRDIPTDLFFPPKGSGNSSETQMIMRICQKCPVQHHCLSAALKMESEGLGGRHGIWGGKTANERKALVRKMRNQADGPRDCPQGHLIEGDNCYVRSDGYRECRICRRERQRRHEQKKELIGG